MRLAVVTDCLSREAGGMFDAVRRMTQELHSGGGVAIRVIGGDDSAGRDLLEWRPLEVEIVKHYGPRSLGYSPELVDALRRHQPSIIEGHGLWKHTSVAVLRASRAIGCPYVVHPHGMLDPWAVRHSYWKKLLADLVYERRHLEGAACLRALNRSEANAFRAYGLRNPICIVPNGVDLPSTNQSSENRDGVRLDHSECGNDGVPVLDGQKVLLYLGRVHPKKNIKGLLNAWASLRTRLGRDHWVLAVAGWDQGGTKRSFENWQNTWG